jgi:uroporphyrinogen decarboxylase
MLTKSELKACLRGEYTKVAPAFFHWMDMDFIAANRAFTEEMSRLYQDDMIQVQPQLTKRARPIPLQENEFTDEWGCRFMHAPGGVGAHPSLPIIHSMEDWEAYLDEEIPLIDPARYAEGVLEAAREQPDGYVCLNIWRTFYERMYMLIGIENLWAGIALSEELFLRMLDDLKAFTLRAISEAAKSGVDCVYLADDWGMQDRLQISPAAWRRHFKPAYADMIDLAHGLNMDVWLHSCGCIEAIVPDLVDIHLDVVGNLQSSAINFQRLSENFRGKIGFFGGLDVTTNLTQGAPASIRAEVEWITRLFQPAQGRYLYAPSNSIMPETPAENVRALFQAIDEMRRA